MKKHIFIALAMAFAFSQTDAKKVLSHDEFDFWEKLTNYSISNNGRWGACAVNPQEGDGILYLYDTSTGKKIAIPRGDSPSFTADSKWAVVKIKPFFADTRKGKINKKKGFDLPQDSLDIVNLADGKVEKIGNVISYKIGKD